MSKNVDDQRAHYAVVGSRSENCVSATHINQRGPKNTDEFKSKKNLENFKDQIGLGKFKVLLTKFQKEIEVKTPNN